MNIINLLQNQNTFLNAKKAQNIQKFASNSITFKGDDKDTFETSKKSSGLTDEQIERQKQIEELQRKKREAAKAKRQEKLNLYHKKLEEHPSIAFLYNPDIPISERQKMAKESDTIFGFMDLAKYTGTNIGLISSWAKDDLIDFEQIGQVNDTKFVDIETEKNKKFIEKIKDRAPHTLSGEDLQLKYNFSEGALKANIKSGKMNVLGFDGIPSNIGPLYALFDMEDETNKRVVEEYVKLTPQPSKKYFRSCSNEKQMVPVQYLQKLGYGKATALAAFIKRGELAGEIIQLPAKEGERPKIRALVDISKYIKGEETLKELRDLNPDADTISNLAKDLGIRVCDVKDAIINDELEIINEYIFAGDRSNVYIDKTNPKNAEFIDRTLFEKEILKEQKAQHRAELKQQRSKEKDPLRSLRAKLVWSMCPQTRGAASYEAKIDGYAASLLAKEAEGEELSEKENIKLKSYKKKFWDRAGSVEYSKAHAKATEILSALKEFGLDGVEDEDARALIEKFLEENNVSLNTIRARISK